MAVLLLVRETAVAIFLVEETEEVDWEFLELEVEFESVVDNNETLFDVEVEEEEQVEAGEDEERVEVEALKEVGDACIVNISMGRQSIKQASTQPSPLDKR